MNNKIWAIATIGVIFALGPLAASAAMITYNGGSSWTIADFDAASTGASNFPGNGVMGSGNTTIVTDTSMYVKWDSITSPYLSSRVLGAWTYAPGYLPVPFSIDLVGVTWGGFDGGHPASHIGDSTQLMLLQFGGTDSTGLSVGDLITSGTLSWDGAFVTFLDTSNGTVPEPATLGLFGLGLAGLGWSRRMKA